jgi:DNA-binding transcriptional MerR regulator
VKRIKLEKKNNAKGFYSIGDVADKTGVKTYILRYWEKEFPFLQPIKNKAGHRLYTQRDIYIVRNIRELLYNRGYSISGAKKILWDKLLGKNENKMEQCINDIIIELREMLEVLDNNLKNHK